eukprot:COSAG02_NODE_3081_length_7407_cov_6.572250_4_plen_77_part_00
MRVALLLCVSAALGWSALVARCVYALVRLAICDAFLLCLFVVSSVCVCVCVCLLVGWCNPWDIDGDRWDSDCNPNC